KGGGVGWGGVRGVDAAADQLVGGEAEVAAAADRQVDAKNAGGADRKLRQPREPAAADAVWKPRRARTAVAVVQDRKRAGVVPESLLHQDLERPRLPRPDRKIRRAVADDRRADEVLEPTLGTADVLAKFFGRQPVDALVPIAVAGDLVTATRDRPDERRMLRRNLAEREERAARPRAEHLQHQIDARLDAALERARAVAARPVPEDLGVEVLLDVDAQRIQHDSPLQDDDRGPVSGSAVNRSEGVQAAVRSPLAKRSQAIRTAMFDDTRNAGIRSAGAPVRIPASAAA